MFVRLKDDQGMVSLVNLMQAKYIQPAKTESDEPAIRIVWSHDTFTDHGEDDIPNDSCEYSEQIYVGVSIDQIESLLTGLGMPKHKPTENGKPKDISEIDLDKIEKLPAQPVNELDEETEEQPEEKPAVKKPAAKKAATKK